MFRNCSQKVCNIYCCHLNICIYLLGSGLYISCITFLHNPLCILRNKKLKKKIKHTTLNDLSIINVLAKLVRGLVLDCL